MSAIGPDRVKTGQKGSKETEALSLEAAFLYAVVPLVGDKLPACVRSALEGLYQGPDS